MRLKHAMERLLRLASSLRESLASPDRLAAAAILIAAFCCALLLRWALFPNISLDIILYVGKWYDYLRQHGLGSFRHTFANYTAPYLYLPYLTTLLPIAKITAIKLLSTLFDLLLAGAVFRAMRYYRPRGLLPYIAAVTCLFLPTVFLNSAFWGQCDALYTAFLVLSFDASTRSRGRLAWAYWGIAIATKLQAVFFLPFLLLAGTRRSYRWYDPVAAVLTSCSLLASPLLLGRPLKELLSAYTSQIGTYHFLTLNAPNVYQWLPNRYFTLLNAGGLVFAAVVITLTVLALWRYASHTHTATLLSCGLLLLLMPFLLPQMHERYFYPAEIFSLLIAFVVPRYFWIPVVMQVASVLAYMPYAFHQQPPISLSVVAFGVLCCIIALGAALLGPSRSETPASVGAA